MWRACGGDPLQLGAPPTEKGPMAQHRLRGPCDPQPDTRSTTGILVKEGTNPSRSRRFPGSHSSQGRARSPVPGTARSRPGFSSENVCRRKHDTKGKTKTTKKTKRPAVKRPKHKDQRPEQTQRHRFRENPKTHGVEKRTPDKPPEQEGCTAKKAGTKKRCEGGGGVSVLLA